MTLGPGSYLVNGNLEFGSKDCHVLIGRYCSIGHRLTFEVGLNHDYHQVTTYPFEDLMSKDNDKLNHSDNANHNQIIIGNDVWIGCDVTIMGGVSIGNGAVIGAGALVAKDVPPYAVVVGNPGRVIKYRFDTESISKLQQIKWWNWPENSINENLELMKSTDKFIKKYYKIPQVIHTDVWDKLSELRKAGWTIIGFIGDFQAEHPLWEKIIREYLKLFTTEDKVIFLLEISSVMDASRELKAITELLKQMGEAAPAILTHNYEESIMPEDVISCLSYFITNREDSTSQYLDYAINYGVEILCGLENWSYKIGDILTVKDNLNYNQNILQELNDKISNYKKNIDRLLIGKKYEEASQHIEYVANYLYEYNQQYTDIELERYLKSLVKVLPVHVEKRQEHKKRRVVFYDGFGLDIRGLAQIYMLALSKIDVDLLYITIADGKGRIPSIEAILNKCGARISYIHGDTVIEKYQYLCKEISKFSADDSFLYTTPYDVSGILAFMYFSGTMTRYQINLTDHAFWLGVHAFDYCLEFRDWGGCVSHKYRKIPQGKLLKQPYYPIINKEEPFAGFPFEKNNGDFVIFSGGWLYKTMDKDDTFYRLIESCLQVVPYTKFWYAGYGDDSKLKILMEKYPDRVFHTGERSDLFQLLEHIDMYLSTCPQGGGLMTQYSAIAGKPPFMLDYYGLNNGIIFDEDKLKISFSSYKECEKELHHFIKNPLYRQEKEQQLKQMKTVISDTEFSSNLDAIIKKHQSKFEIKFSNVDLRKQEELYAERFLQK